MPRRSRACFGAMSASSWCIDGPACSRPVRTSSLLLSQGGIDLAQFGEHATRGKLVHALEVSERALALETRTALDTETHHARGPERWRVRRAG